MTMYQPEEILRNNRDLWDLFVFKGESLNNEAYMDVKNVSSDRFFLKPFMSDYLVQNGLEIEYPEGKQFAVCLTHDVDDIYPPPKYTALMTLYSAGRLDYKDVKKQLWWKLAGNAHSPFINFREIMEIEAAYGARSSFYFMAADRDILRFRYNVEDLDGMLGTIVDCGCEVGLHGGYYTYGEPTEIENEKRRIENVLNRKITGYRNHYLMFRIPETWEYLVKAGFRYDATIGNNRVIGFKNGMCHAFKPVHRVTGVTIDIVELPMVLADFTLFNSNLPVDRLWEISRGMIDSVEKCNGVATLLWHNDVFSTNFRKSWVKLYEKILRYCHQKNAWITSGDQISEWTRKAYR